MAFARFLASALLVVCTACGGGSQPEPVAPAKVSEKAAAPVPEPLTEVEAPEEVFAVLRIREPGKLIDAGMKWSTLPFDWRTLLAKELPGIDRVIDFGAPMDLAVMIDPASGMEPDVLFAASIGVASVDGALSFFQERGHVVKRSERLIRIDTDITCVAARALGKAPARLVCGAEEDAIAALLPYMTRGLPTETLSESDVHAHVLAEPFRRRYGAQAVLLKTAGVPFALRRMALDHPRFDGALRDLLYGTVDEVLALIQDLDHVAVDLSLAEDQSRLSAKSTYALRSAQSKLGAALAEMTAATGAPPDAFWTLPADAPLAFYTRALDRTRFQETIDDAVALMDGYLDYLALSERHRKRLTEAAREVMLMGPPAAYAHFPAKPEAASRSAEPDLESELRRQVGHHLYVVEGEVTPVTELLSAARLALADRGFQKALEERAGLPKGASPTLRERAPRAGGMPPGTKVFEVRLPRKILDEEAEKRTPLSVVVVVASSEDRSYVGVSADEEELIEHMVVAREGKAVLGTRDDLAKLRGESAFGGGYWTLLSVLTDEDSLLSGLAKAAFGGGGRFASRAAVTLPHQGETPVFFQVLPRTEGPSLELTWEVPREAIQDLVALFVASKALGP